MITRLEEKAVEIKRACRLLEVSRSGYYGSVSRRQKPAPPWFFTLKTAFKKSGNTYGSRRLKVVLHAQGIQVGRYRIHHCMQAQGMSPVWKRRAVCTTDSDHGLAIAENRLNREFNPEAMNQSWGCDITYVQTDSGWLYLAIVLDFYSRKVVGWAMAPTMPAQ